MQSELIFDNDYFFPYYCLCIQILFWFGHVDRMSKEKFSMMAKKKGNILKLVLAL